MGLLTRIDCPNSRHWSKIPNAKSIETEHSMVCSNVHSFPISIAFPPRCAPKRFLLLHSKRSTHWSDPPESPSKMLFPLVRIVLIFCIAGLLFFVPRARQTIGSVTHPAGDRSSTSHLGNVRA